MIHQRKIKGYDYYTDPKNKYIQVKPDRKTVSKSKHVVMTTIQDLREKRKAKIIHGRSRDGRSFDHSTLDTKPNQEIRSNGSMEKSKKRYGNISFTSSPKKASKLKSNEVSNLNHFIDSKYLNEKSKLKQRNYL